MKIKIGDLFTEFHSGDSLPSDNIKETGPYVVFGANGQRGYYTDYNCDGQYIIIGRQGAYCGNVNYFSGKSFLTEHAILGKVKEEFDYTFLCYYLRSINLSQFQGQSAQPGLSVKTLSNIEIEVPEYYIQHNIGELLRLLESKISLNRKANEVLESMAKQLYDYWFVQFDFPNAEGKPYKSSGGKMVYNETLKREIPEGWEVKQLAELLELSENGEWGQEEMDANTIDVNCIRGADIVDLIGAPRRCLPNNKTTKLMKEHDIIVEISGGSPTQATGRCNYVSKEILDLYNGKLTCSNFCKFLRLEDKEYAPYFYYLWSLIYKNGNMFHYEGKTSGIKNLQIDNLLAEYWCIPPKDIAYRFFNICTDLNSKVGKNKKETLRLTSLRDYLLPLLMNGQVKIS